MDRRVIASGGRRSARRRPPHVARATRKVFDAAGGPPGATRRAADLSMVRIPGQRARRGDAVASQDAGNDVREPRQAAVPVASAYRRRASGSLDDAPHRPRLPSYPAKSGRDLYGPLSLILGMRASPVRPPPRHRT